MNLAVDIGNSKTKLGVFRDGELIYHEELGSPDPLRMNALIHEHQVEDCIVASVRRDLFDLDDLTNSGLKIALSHNSLMPVELLYLTPETLGKDRIASAVGAHRMFPGKNCLVIDAGTCITLDLVSGDGKFLGGNIAPGLHMRLRAMHEFTGNLPLVEPQFGAVMLGSTTEMAVQNGAILGILMEIAGYMEMLRSKFGQVEVILTGGDAKYFAEKLKTQIFVEPNLVLKGLNEILNFHAKSKT